MLTRFGEFYSDSKRCNLLVARFNRDETSFIEDYSKLNWKNRECYLTSKEGADLELLEKIDTRNLEPGSQTFPWKNPRPPMSPYVEDAILIA